MKNSANISIFLSILKSFFLQLFVTKLYISCSFSASSLQEGLSMRCILFFLLKIGQGTIWRHSEINFLSTYPWTVLRKELALSEIEYMKNEIKVHPPWNILVVVSHLFKNLITPYLKSKISLREIVCKKTNSYLSLQTKWCFKLFYTVYKYNYMKMHFMFSYKWWSMLSLLI